MNVSINLLIDCIRRWSQLSTLTISMGRGKCTWTHWLDRLIKYSLLWKPKLLWNRTVQPNVDNLHAGILLFHRLLALGPRFLPLCTATCTHSCLKSLYFLLFLNLPKNRCVSPQIVALRVCKTVLCFFSQSVLKAAKYGRRLYKIYRVFFASLPSPIRFLASFQTFSLTVHAHRLYQVSE